MVAGWFDAVLVVIQAICIGVVLLILSVLFFGWRNGRSPSSDPDLRNVRTVGLSLGVFGVVLLSQSCRWAYSQGFVAGYATGQQVGENSATANLLSAYVSARDESAARYLDGVTVTLEGVSAERAVEWRAKIQAAEALRPDDHSTFFALKEAALRSCVVSGAGETGARRAFDYDRTVLAGESETVEDLASVLVGGIRRDLDWFKFIGQLHTQEK